MMRALLLLVVLGCDAGYIAKSSATTSATSSLLLPSLTLRKPYRNAQDLREYALPDGRVVRYDGYNDNSVSLWDPATKQVTQLGRAALVAVPRMGWLVETRDDDGTVRLHDIDPDRPALREVWHGAPGAYPGIVGTLDGAVVLEVGDAFVSIAAPGVSTQLGVKLPAKSHVASGDAIRGHRLLATAEYLSEARWSSIAVFVVPVYVLDLDSGGVRAVGTAQGAWSEMTDMPHPYLNVRWDDYDEAARDTSYYERVVNLVDVTTEKLTTKDGFSR